MKKCFVALLVLLLATQPLAAWAGDKADPELTHYLVLGFDFWGDDRIGVSYSDTNILATIDHTNGRLMVTSLLRTAYVEKPDGTWGRLNNIVRDDGFDVMLETVSRNFGVSVDTYIAIGVKGLRRIIDALGGVEVTLTRAEAEKLAEQDIPVNGAGTYKLNAKGAMAYIRLRKIAGHDFGRAERQRKVLVQVFSQLQEMSVAQMMEMAQMLFDEVETNMTLSDLLGAASFVYGHRDATLETMAIPVEGMYENVKRHGMDVYELDWAANRAALNAFLRGE